MTNLIAHSDTKRVDERAVMLVPEPDFTKSWHPISHGKVITALDKACENKGIAVLNKEYSLSENGGKMFGVWNVDSGHEDGCYSLGVRNSVDKSMALGLTAGNKIFVCDNMAFSGDYITFRKHTGGLDLDQLIWMANKAIEVTMERMGIFDKWHRSLKDVDVSCNEIKMLTFDCMKKGVFAGSQFNNFGKAFTEEFELSKEKNLYTMHGAVTRLVRGKSLFQIADATRKLSGVCDNFVKERALAIAA